MIFGVAIAVFFLSLGLRTLSQLVFLVSQWRRSQNWLNTPGKIIQSDLKSVLVPHGGRKSFNIDGSVRLITAFIPNILYEYRANAEMFHSSQIFIGQHFPSPLNYASEFIEKYPVGKTVDVYYDPENPEVSTLEKGHIKELFLHLVEGIIFIFIGFTFLIVVTQE